MLVVVICLRLHPRQPNNPPPRLQLRDGVGFFILFLRQRMTTMTTSHVGSLSSSASICTHDNNDNPPPRLQLRDGVGFFRPFFKSMNDDDDDEPCRLVVVICLHLYPRQPNNPPPRLQLRDGVGFYHHFFRVNERQRRPPTSHYY